jgi:hypothetical protein
MGLWDFRSEDFKQKFGEVFYYKIGSDVLRFNYSIKSNLTFYLESLSHLLLVNEKDHFDFQIYFLETDLVNIQVPVDLLNWGNINPYNGNLIGLPTDYIGVKNSHENSFIWIDKNQKTILYLVKNIGCITPNEQVAPLRSVLHLWYQDSKYFMCHAAGISVGEAGVILTAKGGSGKSTSSLACIQNGLNYAGDDFLLVDSEACIAYSLYNVAKLELNQFEMFKELKPFIENLESTPKEKGQIFLTKIFPGMICNQFKIKALLIPVFSKGKDTVVFRCSKTDAIKALVPSSIWIMRGSPASANKMITFINKLDCFQLATGTDLIQIAEKIKGVIYEN